MTGATDNRLKSLQIALFTRVDGAVFCYGLRLVRPPTSTWPLLGAAVLSGILFTGSTPTVGAAQTGPGLAKQAGALRTPSRRRCCSSMRPKPRSPARRPSRRGSRPARASSPGRRPTRRCERRSCAARSTPRSGGSRRSSAQLYIQGEPDPIAVILGATSLDEAMAGIEGLARATAQNERLAREAAEKGRRLAQLRANWPRSATASTAPARPRAPARRGSRRPSPGQRETRRHDPPPGRPDAQRLAALAGPGAAGRAALGRPHRGGRRARSDRRSVRARRTTSATAGALPRPPTPVTGTHTLVVDAVAYHLPGNTASGLPVGVGVIAVDPTRDPARHARLRPGLRPRGRRRRRIGDQGQHHRSLDADDGAGARLGAAHRHDHRLRLTA